MTISKRSIKANGISIDVTFNVKTPDDIRSVIWRAGGPGDRNLKKRAHKVMDFAQTRAPVGKGPTGGMLKRSFFVRQARQLSGRFDAGYEVGNTAPHFLYVIKGTRPHEIVGNPLLVFDWPKAGLAPAVFRHVHHPGTQPNSFFTDSIRAAV